MDAVLEARPVRKVTNNTNVQEAILVGEEPRLAHKKTKKR